MDSFERYRPPVTEAAQNLYDYLRIAGTPQPADAIFVLGSADLSPAKRAFDLYQVGYAKKIFAISAGGPLGGQKEWGMPECEKYKKELISLGVPEDDVIIPETQQQTTNTLAETKEAIPFMQLHGIDPKKVILVARPFHQRRVNNTFLKQYGDQGIEFINCPSDEPFDPTNTDTLGAIVREAERLYIYGSPTHRRNQQARADIMKFDIPKTVVFSAGIVRRELRKIGSYKGN